MGKTDTHTTRRAPSGEVGVVIPTRNAGIDLIRCLRSIFSGSHMPCVVTVVDDCSTDNAIEQVEALGDERIRIIRSAKRVGAAECRNIGIRETSAIFLFFVDSDCEVDPGWIAEGLKHLKKEGVLGVEGTIFYKGAIPTPRHKIPINPFYPKPDFPRITHPGRDFAAGCVAYRRDALLKEGGFRSSMFRYGREDTDLALRIRRRGKIEYAPEMKVWHAEQIWTFQDLMINAIRYHDDILLMHEHHWFPFAKKRILHPRLLLLTFFPPYIYRHFAPRGIADVLFLIPLSLYLVLSRSVIWVTSFRSWFRSKRRRGGDAIFDPAWSTKLIHLVLNRTPVAFPTELVHDDHL